MSKALTCKQLQGCCSVAGLDLWPNCRGAGCKNENVRGLQCSCMNAASLLRTGMSGPLGAAGLPVITGWVRGAFVIFLCYQSCGCGCRGPVPCRTAHVHVHLICPAYVHVSAVQQRSATPGLKPLDLDALITDRHIMATFNDMHANQEVTKMCDYEKCRREHWTQYLTRCQSKVVIALIIPAIT